MAKPKTPELTVPGRLPLHATAVLSGLTVMVVEIGGARALAPFFGSSLHV